MNQLYKYIMIDKWKCVVYLFMMNELKLFVFIFLHFDNWKLDLRKQATWIKGQLNLRYEQNSLYLGHSSFYEKKLFTTDFYFY